MNFKKYIELLKTPKEFLKQVDYVFKVKRIRFMAHILPDKMYLRRKYRWALHRRLHLNNPKLFNEKLQWLKIHDRKPLYHQMVDKYDAKQFIASRVGDEYNIPVIGVYDSFEAIDFNSLPDAFVLKGTFDSGSYYICKDKSQFDIEKARKQLLINWNDNYYIWSREWPYKGLKHRIIAEPLLVDKEYPYLRDFKFYCFNGEPKIFYITSDKGGNLPTKQDFFDIEGKHLEIQDKHYPNNPVKCPDLPKNLDKMVEMCRVLAKDTYHLRVDFYEINGHIYCGEFTFFEAGGFCEFIPEKYNKILGDWIQLPDSK
jgi:hypothetical protein